MVHALSCGDYLNLAERVDVKDQDGTSDMDQISSVVIMSEENLKPHKSLRPITAGVKSAVRRQPKPFIDRLIGGLAILTVLLPWTYGLLIPPIALVALYNGYVVIGTLLIAVIVYPYFAADERWDLFTDFVLRGTDYFAEHSLTVTDDLGVDRPFLACYHPHAVVSWGMLFNAGLRKDFTGLKGLAAPIVPHIPLLNTVFKWTGCLTSADKESMIKKMKERRSMGLIPGGFEEATISCKGVDRAYLKSRQGFVKYALQYGYDLVPCYTFGDIDTYNNLQGWWDLRLALNKRHIPTVVPFGAWFFPLMPRPDASLHTVMGKVVRLPHIPQPSKEDVDKYHALYMDALRELYDTHKTEFGYKDRKLEIW